MITTFGPNAKRYAPALGDLDAIVADIEYVGDAYLAAVRRREIGYPFYGMILSEDPRVRIGVPIAEQIVVHNDDYDARRILFDQLAMGQLPVDGVPIADLWTPPTATDGICTEFFGLCNAMLVRSFAEAARLRKAFSSVLPRRQVRPIYRILATSAVPLVERVPPERPGVVVWAPHRPAVACTLALHGLAEFHGELTCVSAGGPPPPRTAAALLEPGDARVAEALSRASAVVCLDPGDPADAVAFARQGFGVVAPITSGAHEFAGTVVVWDALDARALFTAVAVAIARPAAVLAEPPRPPRAPLSTQRPAFVPETELPLVTIITPTYNRREELGKMLSCLAVQTYPRIEALVINDGGESVTDVVAQFPFARLVDQPRNFGALRAVELGRTLARGDYIGLLPDDDWLYPDHVERMVNALLRSGASVAHGNGLLRFLQREPDGSWSTYAYNNRTFSQTLTPTEALVTSTIAGHQMLVHRSVYEIAGGYLLDSDVSDNEIHIRFTQRWFYAFVDDVTSEFRDHAGGQGRQCDFPTAMREVYDMLHPVPDRPSIQRVREATIEHVRSREPGKPPFPTTLSFAARRT
jgi:hypothetical protein